LQGKKTNKRVFITTGSFLDETRRYMEMIDSKIVLIDGKQRADQILDNNIGISTENRYDMKEPNSDYFVEL
jgi:restriction system protein